MTAGGWRSLGGGGIVFSGLREEEVLVAEENKRKTVCGLEEEGGGTGEEAGQCWVTAKRRKRWEKERERVREKRWGLQFRLGLG